MSERDFPEGFLWSTSTAAHQVEGGNVHNQWWDWEHRAGTPAVESSGDALDQWTRYADDIALLGGLGPQAHRFSVEWSRIEPAPGEWSSATLDHYKRMLEALAAQGMTAFTTLLHFTVPRWFAERGAWLAPDAVERFGEFCDRTLAALGDLTAYVCTINEPQIVSTFGWLLGQFPPGHRDQGEWRQVSRTLIAAHERAVAAVAAAPGSAQAGICLQMPALEPARVDDPACVDATRTLEAEMIDLYLDGPDGRGLAGDFVGVQYYTRMRIDPARPSGEAGAPAGARLTQMGWEWHPDGLRLALHKAARTGLPLIVTENGIACDDDADRVAYLDAHLRACRQAMDEGVDLRGYTYWSAFDNFEWNHGRRPRFGLVAIDYEAGLARIPRPSAYAYGRVAATGRLAALYAE